MKTGIIGESQRKIRNEHSKIRNEEKICTFSNSSNNNSV